MDKPEVKVSMNRQKSNLTYENLLAKSGRDPLSSLPKRSKREGRFFQSLQGLTKANLLVPFLLATFTGILLGVCLLVLFRGSAEGPMVSTVPAAGGSAAVNKIAAPAELPGATLVAWQLGVFEVREKAETAQSGFVQQGVPVSIRGAGPFQLFAGIAPERKAGAALEAELGKNKVSFYVKEFRIAEAKGVIEGVKEAEAKQVETALRQEIKLADDVLQAALAPQADANRLKTLQGQLTAQQTEIAKGADMLNKAGLKEQATLMDGLHKHLSGAVSALVGSKGPSAVQGELVAFYVTYETLGSRLIKIQ